jgi:hypothetical protein
MFKGTRLVHVRWYNDQNGKTFPTKIGVCFKPDRFAAFVQRLDEIDAAYHYVAPLEDEWRTVHIGGRLYGNLIGKAQCVDFRYYFRGLDGKVRPTAQGISLPIPVWTELKKRAVELKDQFQELRDAKKCDYGEYMEHIILKCPECHPFSQPDTTLPPAYSAMYCEPRMLTESCDCLGLCMKH